MTPNQALLTGALMGSVMRQEFMDVDVEVETDDEGNYTNSFTVVGRKTAERLRVTVTVEPPQEHGGPWGPDHPSYDEMGQ